MNANSQEVSSIDVSGGSFSGLSKFQLTAGFNDYEYFDVSKFNGVANLYIGGMWGASPPEIDRAELKVLDLKKVVKMPDNIQGYHAKIEDIKWPIEPVVDITNPYMSYGFRYNKLSVSEVDEAIIKIERLGYVGGTLKLEDQSPPAPPSAASAVALSALQARGWAVTTD